MGVSRVNPQSSDSTTVQPAGRVSSLDGSRRFVRYALAGGCGTALHWTLYLLLAMLVGLAPWLATMAGALAGALVNYLLNFYLVFDHAKRHADASAKFLVTGGTGVFLNALVVWLATPLGLIAAQLAATACVLLSGYWLNSRWTFSARSPADSKAL